MSCAVFRGLASERLDGPLARDEEQALAYHLVGCTDCAELSADLAGLPALLRAAALEEPPDAIAGEVFASVEADRSGVLGRALRLLFRCLPGTRLVPSTAVSLALLVALAGAIGGSGSEAGLEPARREASLLTVWDTRAETITATVDPAGIGPAAAPAEPYPPRIDAAALAGGVRMFLFERIVVRN